MISIRPATLTDAPVVGQLVEALFTELQGKAPDYGDYAALALKILEPANRTFGLIACSQDAPVGVMMLSEGNAMYAGGAYGQITELYVLREFRSSGVAIQLIAEASKLGRARSWKRLEVGAPHQPEWARSLAFYERAGFVVIGPRLRLKL